MDLLRLEPLHCKILFKTSLAWPAQWEGELTDGRQIYVRYRQGWLAIGVGQTMDLATDHAMGTDPLLGIRLSKDLGTLTLEELQVATAGVVEWPDESEEAG